MLQNPPLPPTPSGTPRSPVRAVDSADAINIEELTTNFINGEESEQLPVSPGKIPKVAKATVFDRYAAWPRGM